MAKKKEKKETTERKENTEKKEKAEKKEDKAAKPKVETRVSFVFPRLHQNVLNAVSVDFTPTWVRDKGGNQDFDDEYSTFVMGRFTCNNKDCSKAGWSSKKVAIRIRGYPNNGYNTVVFNQRCESCKQLGTLTIDKNSYVERIAYRLKKWAGIPTEVPYYASKSSLPHKSELCEGCKRGYCQQQKMDDLVG